MDCNSGLLFYRFDLGAGSIMMLNSLVMVSYSSLTTEFTLGVSVDK